MNFWKHASSDELFSSKIQFNQISNYYYWKWYFISWKWNWPRTRGKIRFQMKRSIESLDNLIQLDDYWRIEFYHGYIGQLHRAIVEDGVNVIGYTGKISVFWNMINTVYCIYSAWSMMDNFEWDHGYSERFGMMWTNFSDASRIGQNYYLDWELHLLT